MLKFASECLRNISFGIESTYSFVFYPSDPYEGLSYPPPEKNYGKRVWCLTASASDFSTNVLEWQNKLIEDNIYIARKYELVQNEYYGIWGHKTEKLGDTIYIYSDNAYDIIQFIKKHRLTLMNTTEYQDNMYWIMDAFYGNL